MKIIITASDNNISAPFDKRFGRATWFCVYNEETQEVSFLKNENINVSNGAGTKAAEKMVELGVKKVISDDFGPKAKDLLDKFRIQMVIMKDDGLVEDIIQRIKQLV